MELSLYPIQQHHIHILRQLEENEGELTPDLEQELSLTEEQFQQQAISYGYIIKSFEDQIEIIRGELDRLGEILVAADRKKELFRHRLSQAMIQFGVEKISSPTLKLYFRKSDSVEIIDDELVPSQYKTIKQVVTPSKNAIKQAIKEGVEVPGAAILTKQNLQIK